MDFSLVLFFGILLSGAIIILYKFIPARFSPGDTNTRVKPSMLLELARAIFPVILLVFLVRSFIIEPYRIPSGSMLSTLHIGDFILVNKYKYGIRLPILNIKIMGIDQPSRGDVMVFRYPRDPSLSFVKRVIGLPGDTITYKNKQLSINGKVLKVETDGQYTFETGDLAGRTTEQFVETIDDVKHKILLNPSLSATSLKQVTVPEGAYFVMGDNRDWSNDSRRWGFVPNENIVGQAFLIWFSWKGLSNGLIGWNRIGQTIE